MSFHLVIVGYFFHRNNGKVYLRGTIYLWLSVVCLALPAYIAEIVSAYQTRYRLLILPGLITEQYFVSSDLQLQLRHYCLQFFLIHYAGSPCAGLLLFREA